MTTTIDESSLNETQFVEEENQQPKEEIQSQSSNSNNTWRYVAIGSLTGILLGASGATLAHHLLKPGQGGSGETEGGDNHEVDIASGVDDKMSFAEAFQVARSEVGPGGAFHWRGNLYSTYIDTEWEEMSQEERAAYGQRVAHEIAPQKGDSSLETEPEPHHHDETVKAADVHEDAGVHDIHHTGNDHPSETEADVQPDSEGDGDFRLIGVHQMALEDGSMQTIAAANVDGHDVVMIDVDGDGIFETIGVDANQDGQIGENEWVRNDSSELQTESVPEPEPIHETYSQDEGFGVQQSYGDDTMDYATETDINI